MITLSCEPINTIGDKNINAVITSPEVLKLCDNAGIIK